MVLDAKDKVNPITKRMAKLIGPAIEEFAALPVHPISVNTVIHVMHDEWFGSGHRTHNIHKGTGDRLRKG